MWSKPSHSAVWSKPSQSNVWSKPSSRVVQAFPRCGPSLPAVWSKPSRCVVQAFPLKYTVQAFPLRFVVQAFPLRCKVQAFPLCGPSLPAVRSKAFPLDQQHFHLSVITVRADNSHTTSGISVRTSSPLWGARWTFKKSRRHPKAQTTVTTRVVICTLCRDMPGISWAGSTQ